MYYFEYGETDYYGNTTEETDVNNVFIDIEISDDITGLSSSTIYHYRLVATNADGTNYGDDRTFATRPAYILDAFSSPYSAPTGLTADGEYFWVVADWPHWIYKRIYKIDTNGSEISSFQTESGDSTVGGEPQGLFFDDTYLWLADPRNDRFIQYDTTGNEISTINSPGPFPTGLAFDGTNFWNADSSDKKIYKIDASGSPVDWFFSPGNNPKGLEFDGTYLWNADSDADRIYKLDTSGTILEILFSPGAYPSGLAFDGRFLWNSDNLDGQIYKIDPSLIPSSTTPLVTTDSATSISAVAAQLNGTLNPNGLNTTYYFEYGTTISYGASTSVNNVNAGIDNVAAGVNLTNFLPDTTYHFRLVAENTDGVVNGADRTFTTLDTLDPPQLTVTPADGLQSTGFLGGPFSPISKTYTLENTGQVALGWTASKSKHWVDLSSQPGTLSPGESTTVEVSINDSANSLIQDTYTDSVIFINTTNGYGNTGRAVVLGIVKIPSSLSCDLSINSMMLGSSLTVSGLIDPPPTAAGAWVDIMLTSPSGDETHIPVQANTLGQFSKTFACHQINRAGVWLVQTSWNGDEQYNGATSSVRPLSVSKAASTLTLDIVMAEAIKINSKPPIGGKFSTIPSCETLNLQDTPITLRITEPDSDEHNIAATANQNGQFLLDYDATGFAFDQLGEWTIEAQFADDDNFVASSSDVITVRVVPTAGYAVIVQGKSMSEEGLASHIKTTNFVYEKLIERQLLADDITYFGWDSSNPAVDAHPFKSAIQTAITETMRDKMIPNPGDLYIVMVNHGWTAAADSDVGEFYIAPDSPLTSSDLSAWLDTLQSALQGTAAEDQHIIVILGFCRAGAFIDDINGNNRVVIASAAADEYSHRGPRDVDENGEPLRDGEYFVSEFFKNVAYGKSVQQCFENATALTEAFTSSGAGQINAPYYDDSLQHPLLDDNGDGIGSNVISSAAGEDGYNSEFLFIGASPAVGNDPGDVVITQVAPAQFLDVGETTVDLWAKVDDAANVRLIWLEVKAPGYDLGNPGIAVQIEMDTFKKPTIAYNNDRFEWNNLGSGTDPADLFSTPGTYQIFYFVKDDTSGHVSPLQETRMYKALSDNSAPNPFALISPQNNAPVLTTAILDWQDTTDPDGHKFTYTVLLSKGDDSFSNPIIIEGLIHSAYLITPQIGIEDLNTYYWKVQAVDKYGAVQETETRFFHTDNTNPVAGWLYGHVFNTSTGSAISDATVQVGSANLVTDANGYYIGILQPGSYSITASAPGYAPTSTQSFNLSEGAVLSMDVGLWPDTHANNYGMPGVYLLLLNY